MKIGSKLTQSKMSTFESIGFILNDGQAMNALTHATKFLGEFNASPMYVPLSTIPSLPQLVELGSPFLSRISTNAFQNNSRVDKLPSICDRKTFQFMAHS